MARKYGKKKEIKIDPLDYNLGLIGISGIGKEQPVSEPILTENGWNSIGNIEVGDKVYGRDGKLHNVINVFPQGVKDVYSVEFSDGTYTRCGYNHLWHVHTQKQRVHMRNKNDYRFQIKELNELMKDYKTNANANKYSVPINKEIIFPEKKVPLDPYLLGLLLGDGGFTKSVVTFTNSEEDIFEELEEKVNQLGLKLKYNHLENYSQARIIINDGSTSNILRQKLSELNLLKCGSREKFIPKDYIYNSVDIRYEILRGLLNTDGGISKGVSVRFSSYSEELALNVAEIARSLGFIVTFNEFDRTNEDSSKKYDEEIEYYLQIIGDISKFNLSKKHSKKIKERGCEYCKSITNIKKIGQEESVCIMLDSDEQLYITRDYIVTHNSTIAKDVCEQLVGPDSYIAFDISKENGHDAIAGIVSETIPDWDYFCEVTDDIIENRDTDWKDLKVIIYDTIDDLFELAEKEVIRLSNRKNPEKQVDTVNGAFGGFGRGQDKAIELVVDKLWELRELGISIFVIGHTKVKTVSDPTTGQEYEMLTTNISNKYFNAIKNKLHVLGVASIDRDIKNVKLGKDVFTGKEKTKGVVENERRIINFRDDNYNVDSKSRFSNITPKIPLDAEAFIKAIKDAIEFEHNKLKNKKDIKEVEQEQAKEKENEVKKATEKAQSKENEKKRLSVVEFITDTFEVKKSKPEELKAFIAKFKEFGYTKADEIQSLTLEQAEELAKLLQ